MSTAIQPLSPRIFEGPITEAYQLAIEQTEPVFCPSRVYCDDRGWSLMNQLQGVLQSEGQVNYSVQFPGVIKAWHRHAEQTDFWMVVQGQMKVGIHRSTDQTSWSLVTGERRPGTLVIPPTLWHGATTAGPVQAGLLYYVTKAFCPESPDEERMAHDAIEGFPWNIEHR